MEQKKYSIYQFNKGDLIVRIEPSQSYGIGFFSGETEVRDRSYVGERLIFIGIANGMIYLERPEEDKLSIEGDVIDLPIDKFSEGWAYYIDPKKLKKEKSSSKYSKIPLEILESQISEAIIKENYEEAARLKKEIDRRNKK